MIKTAFEIHTQNRCICSEISPPHTTLSGVPFNRKQLSSFRIWKQQIHRACVLYISR